MAALDFPSTIRGQNTGTQYTGANGVTYVWDGYKWLGRSPTLLPGTNSLSNEGNIVQVDALGNLVTPSFTLPNNSGVPGQVLKWPLDGTTLVWESDNNSGTNVVNTGNVVFDGNQMYVGGTGFLNLETDNGQAAIGTNGPDSLLVSINEGDKVWTFDANGHVTFPDGSTQVTAYTGETGDSNVWIQTFESVDGAPIDVPALAVSVEYDSAGNVIALFTHYNNNDNSSYYSVGKYTTTGTKIWTARFSDDFNTDGWGLAVDTDTIYVAGETTPQSGGYGLSTLTKLDATDGSIIWSKTYDFGYESSSAVVDVASDGSPVMVGYAYNSTDRYVTTTKVSALDGSITWTRSLDGQGDEEAYGMAVGPEGEVVVIGYMANIEYEGPVNTILTLSASPASDPDWTVNQSITVGGVSFDVSFTDGIPTFSNIVDLDGNHYVGDTISNILGSSIGSGSTMLTVTIGTTTQENLDDRMLVVKYDSTGSIQWQKAILFDEGFNCRGADADIDSLGNIYVTGSYQYSFNGGTTSALSILKLDGNGSKQWSRRVQGDCDTFGVSVVVGADDKLYLSAMTGNNNTPEYIWVAAKYDFNGLVEWQRLIDNTTGWSFTGGIFFSNGGGSNIAVKQDYVVLGGGFGDILGSNIPQATLIQVVATGDVFSVGDWDFKAAAFSGVLNDTASDITVVNAGKTDTDNAENIITSTVTLGTDISNFLIGTLYTVAVGNDRLINNGNELVLGTTGTVTLPQGGTITEGVVTSNPTIQLTPASPDVASQKLVIKGGGNYNFFDNGINLNYYNNTAIVSDTLTFYVNSDTYANQTLYWWIYPAGANLATPSSGTVVLNGSGYGDFNFILDNDDYEFTVRVSPEADNYDPANLGVQSGLINSDAPTYGGDHHLHLTTGNLTETSIFLGTDNHNVRTTTAGNIQITTPNIVNNIWEFRTDGTTTFPTLTVPISDNATPSGTGQTLKFSDPSQQAIIYGPASTESIINAERVIIQGAPGYTGTTGEGGDVYVWAGPGGNGGGDGGDIKVRAGQGNGTGSGGYLNFQAGDSGSGYGGNINIETGETSIHGQGGSITLDARSGGQILLRVRNSEGNSRDLRLDNDGTTTLPGAVVNSTVAKDGPVSTDVGKGEAATVTVSPSNNTNLNVGTVNGVAFGTGFTLDITVAANGDISAVVTASNPNLSVGDSGTLLGGGSLGGTVGVDDVVFTVATLTNIITATAIDLTKTINKLADGAYTLANGVEGQIMYLVRQTGSAKDAISVNVANARIDGILNTTIAYYPFENISDLNMSTLIFTDGAWQASNGGWD